MRVLFDTNVVLDGLLERVPFVEDAALLIDAVVRHEITGILCATTLTTIDCIIGRERAVAGARNTIGQLLEVYEIAPVGRNVLESASASAFLDFEDAVLHAAVQTASAKHDCHERHVRLFCYYHPGLYAEGATDDADGVAPASRSQFPSASSNKSPLFVCGTRLKCS